MTDNTTFFLAFLSLFGGLAWFLYRLHKQNKALEERLEQHESP